MKKSTSLLLLILTLMTVKSYGQLSFGMSHIGFARDFKKGYVAERKANKTMFVLSNLFSKEEYEFILNECWDVSDFEVVSLDEYETKLKEYEAKKESYNVVKMTGYMKTSDNGSYLYIYIGYNSFFHIPKEEQKKDREWDVNMLSRIELFPNEELRLLNLHNDEDNKKFSYLFYNEASMHNYTLGFLKNYFQKLNNLLKDETEVYWMYEDGEYLPELSKLSKETLLVPDYVLTHTYLTEDESREKTFKSYPYKIEFIETDKLDKKIINEEEVYYLRYVQVGAQKFWQVVNSKSGEILYRGYAGGISGLSRELKAKHVADLAKAVKKASK